MNISNLIEGYWNKTPKIKTLSFPLRGKMQIDLEDGRCIIVPLIKFPSIKRLNTIQRQKWFLLGNGFSFDDCNEVYHIEQILGNFQNYNHEASFG
ncbi:MAG: hypothetical protein HY738_04590 [Bacteroidia bacterium]|nr:hypothetical protein [Bacteroidia bacterium]